MMADKKTLIIFGAGTGLGISLAKRFGAAGYKIALVARRAAPLEDRAAELGRANIEAAAFPFDLNNSGDIAALVRSIEERFERIDAAVYAPAPSSPHFVPAANLEASH